MHPASVQDFHHSKKESKARLANKRADEVEEKLEQALRENEALQVKLDVTQGKLEELCSGCLEISAFLSKKDSPPPGLEKASASSTAVEDGKTAKTNTHQHTHTHKRQQIEPAWLAIDFQ